MKAVVCTNYGPPEVLKLQDIEKPVPKDHEVLIKVFATSVTAADFRIRSFTVPPAFWLPARLALGLRKPKKPILGVELSGKIEAIGKGVTRFKVGDAVFAATLQQFGAYATYACLPEEGPIALKPVNITYSEAAAIPVGARTALHYLKKAAIKQGQKVLVYGASGSVGTYAVQLAKYFGAHVTGVCSGSNMELVKSLGADRVLDYTRSDFRMKLERYDAILLAVDKLAFSVCVEALTEKGVCLNVTAPLKSAHMLWTSLTSKKKIIVGETPPESAEALEYLKNLVEAGVLRPVMDRIYSLHQIVEAHRYVDLGHKKGNVGIIVHDKAVASPINATLFQTHTLQPESL